MNSEPSNTYNRLLVGLALAAILLFGLILRISYLHEIQRGPDFSFPQLDAAYHDYWARGIVTGNWTVPEYLSDPEIRDHPYVRPPGYPFFLAFIYYLSGCSYLVPRIVQMGLGLLNCLLAYLLGKTLFGRSTGLIFAAFMSVYWVFIYFEGELLAPSLLVTLALLLILSITYWYGRFTFWRAMSAGILTGLFALVRPNILLFTPVVLAWTWWVIRRRNTNAVFRTWSGFVLGALMVIAPATVRNYLVAHDFVPITSNAGINLYIGNNEKTNGAFPKIPHLKEIAGIKGWNNFDYAKIARGVELLEGKRMKYSEVSSYFAKKALHYVLDHPLRTLKLMAIKAALFWGPVEVANNKEIHYEKLNSKTLRHIPGFPIAISFAIVGLILLFLGLREGKGFEISILVLLFIVTYFMSFLPFFAVERFRVPIIPFLFLFGSYALYRIGHMLISRNLIGFVGWGIMCIALYVTASRPVAPYRPDEARWHFLRANAYNHSGRIDPAIKEFREAIKVKPDYADAHYNLGLALVKKGQLDEAISQYSEAVRIRPNSAKAHNNLGFALVSKGRLDEAIVHYTRALRIKPDYAKAHNNLGVALARKGKTARAIAQFSEALRLRPDFADARKNLKVALDAQKKIDRAIFRLQEALKYNAKNAALHYRLGNLYRKKDALDKAIAQYQAALSIKPMFIPALNNLALAFAGNREYNNAISVFKKMIGFQPERPESYYNIACLYSRQNRVKEAIFWLKEAIKKGYNKWDLIKTDKDLENVRGSAYYKSIR